MSLSKLSIESYKNADYQGSKSIVYARYNPGMLDLNYQLEYGSDNYINNSGNYPSYKHSKPGHLVLNLLFDEQLKENAGVNLQNQLYLLRKATSEVSTLGSKEVFSCGKTVQSATRDVPYLKIKWGDMQWYGSNDKGYKCRLESMSVAYTLFDDGGDPLRANVTLQLLSMENLDFAKSVTSISQVKVSVPTLSPLSLAALAAANLAAAASKVVNSDYLDIAYGNDMDSLDSAAPGDELVVEV